jgi:Cu+-exporting ATPase
VLSLSYPVALGHGLRQLGKRGFYLKNASVMEQLTGCDTIVFDKTGTLTTPASKSVTESFGQPLNLLERAMIRAVVNQSAHPLSRRLSQYLANESPMIVENFTELPGQGVIGIVDDSVVKIGRAAFVGGGIGPANSVVHVSIDGTYRGYFQFAGQLRNGLADMLTMLRKQGKQLCLLSGDTDATRTDLNPWFAQDAMTFNCQPEDKLNYIQALQRGGRKVLMVGDGLNDAGALKQADVGLAVTDDTLQFTPASDAILESRSLQDLPYFLGYCQFAMLLIRLSFAVSLLYNLVGLSFAATGHLSPVVAAVLMPLSSATMVLMATVGMRWYGR